MEEVEPATRRSGFTASQQIESIAEGDQFECGNTGPFQLYRTRRKRCLERRLRRVASPRAPRGASACINSNGYPGAPGSDCTLNPCGSKSPSTEDSGGS